ncbi:hypothetical protein EZV62_015027 [Acer yangbiense]|uniref:Uncharacterized protein n=1 Tax=Acer yangbiense TaxID=1000413 RepID=A0A5C7HUJ2_9ROSI|nr:hypothetical protein EZV62_015027 [Acer yangbiense]
MESLPSLTNLLATQRAHNIPYFMNWLFQLKPNSLDGEFKDEMDVVETSEPTDAERQQPYMIGFDNNLYMSPYMHLGGGLLDESQKEMMEEVDAVEDDKITTIFSKEIHDLELRMMQNFNMIRKELREEIKEHLSKLLSEKEANYEPPMYTYTGYEREHGDLPDEDEEPIRRVDPIDLTSFASPTPNINIPNEILTMIALEKKDH